MAAAVLTQPLTIDKGTAPALLFRQSSGGLPADLTGCSATAHIRAGTPELPGAIVINASTEDARLEIYGDAEDGVLRWALSEEDTDDEDLAPGDYVQELWIRFADDTPTRVWVRTVQVQATGGMD